MKVYFVRHGESTYNKLNLCNSNPKVDVHLTELGKKQVEKVAEGLKDKKIDLIITSEFPRTKETAEIINKYHNAPIKVDPRIGERNSGIFDGRPIAEFRKFIKGRKLTAKPPKGESFLEEKKRVIRFLKDLKKMKYESIVVVTHEQVMRIIYGYFKGLSDEETYNVDVKNCEVYEFEI